MGDSVANDDISSGYFEWSGNYDRLGGQVNKPGNRNEGEKMMNAKKKELD
jgi:hypothetical protein